jgi:hypothetical protein
LNELTPVFVAAAGMAAGLAYVQAQVGSQGHRTAERTEVHANHGAVAASSNHAVRAYLA